MNMKTCLKASVIAKKMYLKVSHCLASLKTLHILKALTGLKAPTFERKKVKKLSNIERIRIAKSSRLKVFLK